MSSNLVFVDRRQNQDRRNEQDPSGEVEVNLLSRKRRKASDRRAAARSLLDDYYAYMRRYLGKADYAEPQKARK